MGQLQHAVGFHQHALGTLDDAVADGGELHRAPGAFEQGDPQVVLQPLDAHREGGLADVAALGGAAEVLRIGQGHGVTQFGQGHRLPGSTMPQGIAVWLQSVKAGVL